MTAHTLCVVLHYGSEDDTWRCVRTLAGVEELDILIADNDPAQSLSVLPEFRGRVALHRTGGSASFAEANNAAVRYGRSAYHHSILLLNNDTLLGEGALSDMSAVLQGGDVGAVGPCMPLPRSGAGIWACGGVIDRLRVYVRGVQPPPDGLPCDVDYLPGAAILCKLEAWDTVGGLPDKYFLGYEEAEFALRCREFGYRIMIAPGAIVLHSVGMSSEQRPMYTYNSIRGRLRFGQYLWGALGGFALAATTTLLSSRRSRYGVRLWLRAVADEIRGRPLDSEALQDVGRRYPG